MVRATQYGGTLPYERADPPINACAPLSNKLGPPMHNKVHLTKNFLQACVQFVYLYASMNSLEEFIVQFFMNSNYLIKQYYC